MGVDAIHQTYVDSLLRKKITGSSQIQAKKSEMTEKKP